MEDVRRRADLAPLLPLSVVPLVLASGPTSGNFQHETSSVISRRQPGSLTTINASASLCYHLPRVDQLNPEHEHCTIRAQHLVSKESGN